MMKQGFNDSSDVDFLVQSDIIDMLDYFDNYMDFKEKLENLFCRQIDLLENQAVRNPIFRKIPAKAGEPEHFSSAQIDHPLQELIL